MKEVSFEKLPQTQSVNEALTSPDVNAASSASLKHTRYLVSLQPTQEYILVISF